MADDNLTHEAYQESLKQLRELVTPAGYVASSVDKDNYYRIFGRDGAITLLAGLMSGEPDLVEAGERTLDTLARYQDETGRIPSNVTLDGSRVSYGTSVGRVDATLWFVVVATQHALHNGHRDCFDRLAEPIARALFYLKCLELNGRHLIYVPQGGDWADEYVNHGYVLYDELLYYLAWRGYERLSGSREARPKREILGEIIKVNYLPDKANRDSEHVYHRVIFDRALREYEPPLPVAYFTNHSIRYHYDNMASALFLLSDLPESQRAQAIQQAIQKRCTGHNGFPILPAFYPVVHEGSHKWEHLRVNYLYEFKNKPYHFHNGGRWPLVHGFFIASLGKKAGLGELDKFAQVLERDNYTFPEYYHGETYEALGTPELGFSASAYIIAYQALTNNKKVFK